MCAKVEKLVEQYLSDKIANADEVFFCSFMKVRTDPDNRTYEFQSDYQRTITTIGDVMKEESLVQLVLFKDAIKHIIRICRITNLEKGHLIIVGLGGSGKRSLCALSAIL